METSIGGAVRAGFNALGRLIGAGSRGNPVSIGLAAAVTPSTPNVGEEEWVDQMKSQWSRVPKPRAGYVSPAIGAVDAHRDNNRAIVHITDDKSDYHAQWATRPGAAQLPDIIPVHGKAPPFVLGGRAPTIGYNPDALDWGEENADYPDMIRHGVPSWAEDHANNPVRAAEGLPDIPRDDRPLPHIPLLQPGKMLVVSVQKGYFGVRLSFQAKSVPLSAVMAPRYQDTKYGAKLVGFVNQVITATYGVASEASDAGDVFFGNMYGVENGVIKPALLLEGGSWAKVAQGYLEGDYRIDATGFALDYGIQQSEDWLRGGWSTGTNAIDRGLGSQLPYSSTTLIDGMNRRSKGEDYVQYTIRTGTDRIRAADQLRQARVSRLFPQAKRVYGQKGTRSSRVR
ncbi:MAG: hypothetical protein [Microviridae sp.]|nr:MAG: hypothetical protein [Microviridae sp.]